MKPISEHTSRRPSWPASQPLPPQQLWLPLPPHSQPRARRKTANYVVSGRNISLRADAHAVAQEKYKPVRAVFEAELPPCPDDVVFGDHWFAHNWLWRKHGLDQLRDAWNDAGSAMCETVEAILQTEAAGLFGVGVKLAALPDKPDPEDYEDAVAAVLNDIDRLLGSDFAARAASLMEHDLELDESPNDGGDEIVAA